MKTEFRLRARIPSIVSELRLEKQYRAADDRRFVVIGAVSNLRFKSYGSSISRPNWSHPNAFVLANIVAASQKSPRKVNESIECLVTAAETQQRPLSDEDYNTLRTICRNNLSDGGEPHSPCPLENALLALAECGVRSGLLEAALKGQESAYELSHPDAISALIDLGIASAKCGHYSWALNVLNLSLSLSIRSLGTEHIVTGYVRLNIGHVLSALGRHKDGIDAFLDAAIISTQALGSNDLRVAQIYGFMADGYFKLSRFDTSIQMCTSVIENLKRSNSMPPVQILETLARAYTGRGNFEKALEIYKEVLETKKALFYPEHMEVADTIHNMGITLQGLRQFTQAINSFEKALAMYKSQIRSRMTLVRIANATKNLGCSYSEQGEYKKAITLFKSALKIDKFLGQNDIGTVNTLTNLGVAYSHSGRTKIAKSSYKAALHLADEKYQSDCRIEIGDLLYNIVVAKAPNHNRSAIKYLRRCITIFTTCLGDSHPKSLRANALMRSLVHRRNQMASVRKLQHACEGKRAHATSRHR